MIMRLKDISDIFELLISKRHDVNEAQECIATLMLKHNLLLINIFCNGIIQSVIKHSPIHDQLKLFNFLDKLNHFWPYSILYMDYMKKQTKENFGQFLHLEIDSRLMSFNTSRKHIDYRSPFTS